jgi:transketolase
VVDVEREEQARDLRRRARAVRLRDLEIVHKAGLGHIGGEFSATDILVTLYFAILRVDPANPEWPDRDRFVLSKGHAAAALYVTLGEAGFFDPADLDTFMGPLSRFNGHPDRTKVPGVETNTGPLGHGLPVAVGMALSARLDRSDRRVFVLTGDGELQEGSNWEAAMTAGHRGLDNLTLIIDRNGLQQGDTTERTNTLEPLADRWRAFGWAVAEVDGHDFDALLDAFASLPLEPGRPSCLIARTRKGCGVSFMENGVAWHHRIPTRDELARALVELEAAQ